MSQTKIITYREHNKIFMCRSDQDIQQQHVCTSKPSKLCSQCQGNNREKGDGAYGRRMQHNNSKAHWLTELRGDHSSLPEQAPANRHSDRHPRTGLQHEDLDSIFKEEPFMCSEDIYLWTP